MFKTKGIYILGILLIPIFIGFNINLDTNQEANQKEVSTTNTVITTFQNCSNNSSIISFVSSYAKAQSSGERLFLPLSGDCTHTCKDGEQFSGSDCCASTGEELCADNDGWDQCAGPLKECDPSDCDDVGEN